MYYTNYLKILFVWCLLHPFVHAQSISKSDKAVFYNLTFHKCNGVDCVKPYDVTLKNINTVTGRFKPINPNEAKPIYQPNDFLITVYDKRSGKQLYETVIPNPVVVDAEYDAEASSDGHTLQHATVELPEGEAAVRLPFATDECLVMVSFIATPQRIIQLITF